MCRWAVTSPFWRGFWRLAFVGALLFNLAVTVFLTFISAQNYPGGSIGAILESIHDGLHKGENSACSRDLSHVSSC
jgi:hypothetical protein